MNIKKFSIFLIITIFFISCKEPKETIISFDKDETLKALITEKESDVLWTKEIEPEILNENLRKKDSISEFISITLETIALSKKNKKIIYPSIANFPVIDTSSINEKILKTVNTFCNSVCNNLNTNPKLFMNEDLFFSYIFFKSNLMENWNILFGEEFPYTFEDLNNDKKKINLFDEYLIGKEKETNDFFEIPVRLYRQNKYINVILYVDKEKDFLINEISIYGWGDK